MNRLAQILKKYWGYDGFRPLQGEAVEAVLANRDSLVVMPTGGGKSLCYQAPAVFLDGMALVVSPLISLMKDQVDSLCACGVQAGCINSAMTESERREVDAAIRRGELKLLYVAPERLVQPRFIEYLRKFKISFIAIDEAHCISHWGHDFRPEYRELRVLKEHFPEIAFHAYTATATAQVRDDICAQLELRTPSVLVGNFDRPNLVYRAERRVNMLEQVKTIIDRYSGDSGIVYCITRKAVDELCSDLVESGLRVFPYHAGLAASERKQNQDAFLRDDDAIMVATVAFGMGIDKPNVRYVVHAGMPKSIEHYQQESGRAGRDGLEAECVLLYSSQDMMTWRNILSKGEAETSEIATKKLREMEQYCGSSTCRHAALVAYFGQKLGGSDCGACDRCLNDGDVFHESSEAARAVISCIQELGDIAGPTYTALVLSGSRDKRVLDKGHDGLNSWGSLSEHESTQIRSWIEQLVAQDFLSKEGEYNILHLSALTNDFLAGGVAPRLLRPEVKREKKASGKAVMKSWAGVDKALFEHLRKLRAEIARKREVPAYVIFGDATLRDAARTFPTSEAEFLQVRGVGERKCKDFGEAFLSAIREYLAEHERNPEPGESESTERQRKIKDTAPRKAKDVAWPLFDQGFGIPDVAARMGRASSTVTNYLEGYIIEKGISNGLPWVDEHTMARVGEAVALMGDGRLRPIFDYLNSEIPYETIRLALACLRNGRLSERDS